MKIGLITALAVCCSKTLKWDVICTNKFKGSLLKETIPCLTIPCNCCSQDAYFTVQHSLNWLGVEYHSSDIENYFLLKQKVMDVSGYTFTTRERVDCDMPGIDDL